MISKLCLGCLTPYLIDPLVANRRKSEIWPENWSWRGERPRRTVPIAATSGGVDLVTREVHDVLGLAGER